MNLSQIAVGKNPPEDVNVIIENGQTGSQVKHEFDKDAGMIVVDRFIGTPMHYPGNYGFIPNTLGGDGDPLDGLVLSPEPLLPGSMIRCRPLGVLLMEDDGGMDEKLVLVPVSKLTPIYDDIKNYTDLPQRQIDQIKHFFEHYKDLEPGKWVKIEGWGNVDKAKELIVEGIDREKSEKDAA